MQELIESGHEVSVRQCKIVTSRLAERLKGIARVLTPVGFRVQFGRRFNVLLGATGLDWNLEPDNGFYESELDVGDTLLFELRFPKADWLLVLTSTIPGLPENIIEAVLDSLEVVADDWLRAVEETTTTLQVRSPEGDLLRGDHYAIRVTSSNRNLPEFLPARLIHKLRNNLTPIISGAGQLCELAQAAAAADQTAMAEIVMTGAQLQERLINRFMLTYCPLDIQRRHLNLTDPLRSIISKHRATGQRPIAVVELSEEVTCFQDDNLLQIIIDEVITNALEAVGGDPVSIGLAFDEKSAALRVSNSGSANPDETERQFFTPFYSRKPNHDGLGLPIARRLARELGGDIRCSATADVICCEIEIPRNLNKI